MHLRKGEIESLLLSACLIVKDEEKHLSRCLASLKGLADEIVVVDTGSSDNTPKIAEESGARVYFETWQDDFALHRNQVIEKANGKWILIIDADEEVVNTDFNDTRKHLEEDSLPPVLLVRLMLSYHFGQSTTLLIPRMIRKSSGIRFVHPVHEQLNVQDSLAILSNVNIQHHGYLDPKELESKERRNLRISYKAENNNPHITHCRCRSHFSLSEWKDALDNALKLLEMNPSPILKFEGSIIGAASAFNLGDETNFLMFANNARVIAPDNPDLKFLEFLQAGKRYIDSLKDGDSFDKGEFLRPWFFCHNKNSLQQILNVLLGKSILIKKDREAIT